MKLIVKFQDKTLEHTQESEITSLASITEKLCSLFSIPNAKSYSLFLANGSIIDNLNLIEDNIEIVIKSVAIASTLLPINVSSNSLMVNNISTSPGGLSTSPSSGSGPSGGQMPLSIDTVLVNLLSEHTKKKALFDLKDLMKDENNARKFVEKNGIVSIIDQFKDLTGNTLSYALLAIQSIMSYEFGLMAVPISLMSQLLPLVESGNPSVLKSSLYLLYLFSKVSSNTAVFQEKIKSFTSSKDRSFYQVLVDHLSSYTVDVQLNSLTLINSILHLSHQNPAEFLQVLGKFDAIDINSSLKKLVESVITPELKKQLYLYQKYRLLVIKHRKATTFNKDDPQHEALLMKLWTLTYPNVKLENRVSEQWKLMGFQGTDPTTDFRGMGIFGLDNLVHMAEHHNDKFKKIVNGQIDRKEREYPTCTAGINITQMLYDIFKIQEDINVNINASSDYTLFPILFSHNKAFEEVYCITFQILDGTWDDMNGSYMDWSKIITCVKNQILTTLNSKPSTLEAFHWAACLKNSSNMPKEEEDPAHSTEDIKQIKHAAKKEIYEIIKNQKIQFFQDGFIFKLFKPLKSKQSTGPSIPLTHLFIKCSTLDHQEINYAFLTDSSERPTSNLNTCKVSDIQYSSPNEANINGSSGGGSSNSSNNTSNTTNSNTNANTTSSKKGDKSQHFTITINNADIQYIVQQSLSPILSSSNSHPSSGGSNSSGGGGNNNQLALDLVSIQREDMSLFSDALKVLAGKDFNSLESIEEYKTLSNLTVQLKLLDLVGVEIPKETPKIPDLPMNYEFKS
ncbi:hypothetical protein CYY_000757 [Polysphondylium violaceum]|uniref:ELMO domain-containing protein n=1 Tax=Polysphondylium violaceum TaxID=133409 RepID=A0A8J4V8M1_9MYCE|nr:hypothetical protein CYY_000757 [Polysphondylium violaceum]